MPFPRELAGQQFGRLTAIRRNGRQGRTFTWLCQCECGKQTTVAVPNLTSGNTKSCGCFQDEKRRESRTAADARGELTQAYLKERVTYDPDTGEFRWREPGKHNRYSPGDVCGSLGKRLGYWRIAIDKKEYLGHQLAWLYMTGALPTTYIDHINRNRADNRWANLRLATAQQNMANRARWSNAPAKGVRFVPKQRLRPYKASIEVNGQFHYLGSFATLDEAKAAYAAAGKRFFGEFHRDD